MTERVVQLGINRGEDVYFTQVNQRKNHTKYAFETKKIQSSNILDYGKNISFDIPIIADLLGKSRIEIKLPTIDIDDTVLKNINSDNYTSYLTYKNNVLDVYTEKINYWKTKYDNFVNYSNIQINIYLEIKKLLKISNFNLTYIQNKILQLLNNYDDLYTYQILIETNILNSINISGYILDTDFLSNLDNFNDNVIISIINTEIDKRYNNIKTYLNYYFSNINYYTEKYNTKKTGKIFYKYTDYLSHYYFDFFDFNIDGMSYDRYTSDILHIEQLKNIHDDYVGNYNKLIGNENSIYNDSSVERIIYTPLIFFFCNDAVNYLPIVALQNSSIKIYSKINSLSNLIYFMDWEEDYENNLYVEISREDHNINDNNTIVKYNFGDYTPVSFELLHPQQIYKYKFSSINEEVLKKNYTLSSDEVTSILNKYGIDDASGNKIMTKNEWIYMKNNIKSDDDFDTNVKLELLDYHYYMDYNYLLNIIPKPNISLLVDYGYLDDIEKSMLSRNNLEYLIETHHEVIFDISNSSYYDSIDEVAGLVKEMFYFYRPYLEKEGYNKYSKSKLANFNDFTTVEGEIFEDIEINISNEYNIFEFININNNYGKYLQYNLLEGQLPDGVQYRSFSLFPMQKTQPSGSLNMNSIKGQHLSITFDSTVFDSYVNNINNVNNTGIEFKIIYKKYNILNIKDSTANLLFYS